MPNTHVPLKYACIAGMIAGTAYQIIQWTYIQFQLGLIELWCNLRQFCRLPLFLIWLNTSWLTTLLEPKLRTMRSKTLMSRRRSRRIEALH